MPEVGGKSSRYRVRRTPAGPKHRTHFIDADGRERAISGGAVATPDEAANEAALAILGHHVGGDWPRACRLVDGFEREFIPPLNVRGGARSSARQFLWTDSNTRLDSAKSRSAAVQASRLAGRSEA